MGEQRVSDSIMSGAEKSRSMSSERPPQCRGGEVVKRVKLDRPSDPIVNLLVSCYGISLRNVTEWRNDLATCSFRPIGEISIL